MEAMFCWAMQGAYTAAQLCHSLIGVHVSLGSLKKLPSEPDHACAFRNALGWVDQATSVGIAVCVCELLMSHVICAHG